MFHSWLPRFNRWGSFLKRKTGILNNKTINMEKKFKVGDLVKVKMYNGDICYGQIREVYLTYCCVITDNTHSVIFPNNEQIELRYPSDHDLLDFAARDSMVAELKAENEALKAELEKWKPKPESITIDLYLYRGSDNTLKWSFVTGEFQPQPILARKTVTITEGEGM